MHGMKVPEHTNPKSKAVAEAFGKGLRRFIERYPDAHRPTVEEFAIRRFNDACTDEKQADPRFADEAPAFAYMLLVMEAANFNNYANGVNNAPFMCKTYAETPDSGKASE